MEDECSSLELFLLALVKHGLSTAYELLTQAGVSVGASSRALRRLKSGGLMVSTSGKRRSRHFRITAKGDRRLSRFWEHVTKKTGPISLDSALRVLCLGWLFQDPTKAIGYANWAVGQLRRRAAQRRRDAEDFAARVASLREIRMQEQPEVSVSRLSSTYQWIKGNADAHVMKAEADALELVLRDIIGTMSASGSGVAPEQTTLPIQGAKETVGDNLALQERPREPRTFGLVTDPEKWNEVRVPTRRRPRPGWELLSEPPATGAAGSQPTRRRKRNAGRKMKDCHES